MSETYQRRPGDRAWMPARSWVSPRVSAVPLVAIERGGVVFGVEVGTARVVNVTTVEGVAARLKTDWRGESLEDLAPSWGWTPLDLEDLAAAA